MNCSKTLYFIGAGVHVVCDFVVIFVAIKLKAKEVQLQYIDYLCHQLSDKYYVTYEGDLKLLEILQFTLYTALLRQLNLPTL